MTMRMPLRFSASLTRSGTRMLAERGAALHQMEERQHGPRLIRNTIVRQYGQDAWAAISAEVRKLRPAAPW